MGPGEPRGPGMPIPLGAMGTNPMRNMFGIEAMAHGGVGPKAHGPPPAGGGRYTLERLRGE